MTSWLSVMFLYSTITFFMSENAFAKSGKSRAPIAEEMDALFITISELLPIVLQKSEFENPARKKEISQLMGKLSKLSTKMNKNISRFSDHDPSIPYIAERFELDIQMAIDMWNSGDRIVPRRLLRNITDYCISCHTRTNKGLQLSEMVQTKKFKSMPAIARAEFLAATRQYDDALKLYEHNLVERPLAKMDPEAWSISLKRLLAISIRVRKNSSLTTEFLSKIQDSPESIAPHLRSNISTWRRVAKEWAEEKRIKVEGFDQKISLCRNLIKEGETLETQESGGGLIQFLRASTYLHELLASLPTKEHTQELYLLAGKTSEYLRDLNLYTLQESYFESCIRKGDNKAVSNQCYEKLENSMIETYGSNSYSGLPDYAKKRLSDLKRLSAQ